MLPARLTAIGLHNSLNWRTHLLFSIPAVLSAGLFDFDRLGGSPSLWIMLAFTGVAVTVITIELLSALTKKRSWKKAHPFVVLLILGIAGLVRGVTIFYLGQAFDLIPESDLIFRATGAPIFVIALYFIADMMISSFVQHRNQLKRLEAQKAQLVRTRDGFEVELRRLDDAQRARVRELVAPSIWELQKHLSPGAKNVQDAIFELKSLNEEIVRPLSHQYATAQEEQTLSNTEISAVGDSKPRGIPSQVDVSKALDPLFFTLTTVVLSFSGQVAALGLSGAVVVVGAVSALVLVMFATFKFLVRGRKFRTTTAISLTVYAGAAIGGLAGYAAVWLELVETQLFPVQSALFVALNMLFTLLVGSFQQERDNSLVELTKTLEDLEILNSRLRQRAWLSRKSLAMELHGSIQGTLQSVAAKLAKAKNPSDKELEAALTQIREAFDKVGSADYLAGKSLAELLEDLVLLWDGALDVQIEIDDATMKALDQDQASARVLLELCREAVINAAKHGQAEQVKIHAFSDDDFVVFTAFNDGISMTEGNQGRGMELYKEVSHRFALHNVTDGVKLDLLLPIVRSAQL